MTQRKHDDDSPSRLHAEPASRKLSDDELDRIVAIMNGEIEPGAHPDVDHFLRALGFEVPADRDSR